MKGKEVAIQWHGRSVQAWVPNPLSRRDFEVSTPVARHSEQAAAAALRAQSQFPTYLEPLARLLLRQEGIASSFIEGIEAPVEAVAAAELDGAPTVASASVADNLATVTEALSHATRSLTIADVHAWHHLLMRHGSSLPLHLKGAFRDTQGWIGGTTPLAATFVPAPADLIDPLMIDLVQFANREDLDPIIQAALVHAQFETIHPYGDGNGRIGRILIGWVLAHRLSIRTPPPVSVFMARDVGGYLSGLTLSRLGQLDPWVEWLATMIRRASEASIELVAAVGELQTRWEHDMTGIRSHATARRLVALLLNHPVLTSAVVVEKLGVSERAAQLALRQLASLNIIQPRPNLIQERGRPRQWWSAAQLLDAVANWGRL